MGKNMEALQKRIDFFRESGRPVPSLLEVCLVRQTYKQRTGKKLKVQLLPWYVRKEMIRNKQ